MDRANLFAEQFASNSSLNDDGHSLPVFPSYTDKDISVHIDTPKNVARIIHSLDASKATGPNGIAVVEIQSCCPELAPIIVNPYDMRLADSVFPSSWKVLSIVPAF